MKLHTQKCKKLEPNLLLQWLLNRIRQDKEKVDKVLIYCKSIGLISKLFSFFKEELLDDIYHPTAPRKSGEHMIVGMYHRKTSEENKTRVLDSLMKSEGTICVLLATTSLGIGVNIPDIKYVIHFGPPKDVEDYVQAVGRAGRDGAQAFAILYFTGNLLGKCSLEMKMYGRTEDTCLRQALYESFDKNPGKPKYLHNCCSFCEDHCKCNGDKCSMQRPEYVSTECSATEPIRQANEDQKQLLKELLNEYKNSLETLYCDACFTSKQFVTGFSTETISTITEQCNFICSVDYIMENLPIMRRRDAAEIMLILIDVFEDVDTELVQPDMKDTVTGVSDLDTLDLLYCEEFIDSINGDEEFSDVGHATGSTLTSVDFSDIQSIHSLPSD